MCYVYIRILSECFRIWRQERRYWQKNTTFWFGGYQSGCGIRCLSLGAPLEYLQTQFDSTFQVCINKEIHVVSLFFLFYFSYYKTNLKQVQEIFIQTRPFGIDDCIHVYSRRTRNTRGMVYVYVSKEFRLVHAIFFVPGDLMCRSNQSFWHGEQMTFSRTNVLYPARDLQVTTAWISVNNSLAQLVCMCSY